MLFINKHCDMKKANRLYYLRIRSDAHKNAENNGTAELKIIGGL